MSGQRQKNQPEQAVAAKAVTPLPGVTSYRYAVRLLTSVVRENRTLRSVGAGSGRLLPATRWRRGAPPPMPMQCRFSLNDDFLVARPSRISSRPSSEGYLLVTAKLRVRNARTVRGSERAPRALPVAGGKQWRSGESVGPSPVRRQKDRSRSAEN